MKNVKAKFQDEHIIIEDIGVYEKCLYLQIDHKVFAYDKNGKLDYKPVKIRKMLNLENFKKFVKELELVQ